VPGTDTDPKVPGADLDPLVATILPPHEGYAQGTIGAVGTVVRSLVRAPGFRPLVIGGPQVAEPYDQDHYRAVRPALWWPGNTNIRYGAALLWPLRRLRPALIEVHNRPELALWLAGWLARWLPRCPVILFLHNDPQDMRQARTSAMRTHLLATLARVVVVSHYLRDRLLDGVPTPARAPEVLPNPIDLAALPPPAQRRRVILFAGRLVADKGADTFVSACAAALPHLPGWHAEMIGADRFRADSPETEFSRVTRAAADGAGVRALGYRDRDAVLLAMARAAIVAVPSRWPEPFGLVALEALASGTALICTDRGGLREVAGDAALYVPADDPPALTAAIRALAADPARREALCRAGQERARLFDAPGIAVRLAALRRQVLAEAGG
jgi:UDP-glucose:(glucosyl)LPS alpha-1,2-glucosyltransferase